MTEAVAYALHCLGQEGLHTSLKPEEGLIYLYDGRMVRLSSQASVGSTIGSTKTCHNLYGTKLRHPDHRTIIKVDKGLFWLQTSVQAFLTNA